MFRDKDVIHAVIFTASFNHTHYGTFYEDDMLPIFLQYFLGGTIQNFVNTKDDVREKNVKINMTKQRKIFDY
jgi:hypothetical protein